MVGIVTFMFSIAVSVSIYAEKNNAQLPGETCYYCNWEEGTCHVSSGTGWTECIPSSPGSTTCALGGGNNCDKGNT